MAIEVTDIDTTKFVPDFFAQLSLRAWSMILPMVSGGQALDEVSSCSTNLNISNHTMLRQPLIDDGSVSLSPVLIELSFGVVRSSFDHHCELDGFA